MLTFSSSVSAVGLLDELPLVLAVESEVGLNGSVETVQADKVNPSSVTDSKRIGPHFVIPIMYLLQFE
jgi:hypothetical protein